MEKKRYETPRIIFLNQEVSGWPSCTGGSGGDAGQPCANGNNNRYACTGGDYGDIQLNCGQGMGYQFESCNPGTAPDGCMPGNTGAHTGFCQLGGTDSSCPATGNGVGGTPDCNSGNTYSGACKMGNTPGSWCTSGYVACLFG